MYSVLSLSDTNGFRESSFHANVPNISTLLIPSKYAVPPYKTDFARLSPYVIALAVGRSAMFTLAFMTFTWIVSLTEL